MSTKAVKILTQVMNIGYEKNILRHHTEDTTLNGRNITIEGKEMINFGSCSYLGLEQHPALKQGVIDAVTKFGTQFSSSRTYASLGLYETLESQLKMMFKRPVVVAASTTLGHLATIPVIVGDDDAVILDMQVHNSVQMTVNQLKAEGVPVTIIRHNDMEALEKKIQQLRNKHQKIWYFADGVYSMYGDYAPFDRLVELMNQYEQFHTYVDDAHGMSWTGENGTGLACSKVFYHEKMVLAGSLNKSFATAGGFIAFPNQEMADKVKNCGGTMIFCGPIQPPMLGAAIASTKLHCSDEILPIQQKVADLVTFANQHIEDLGLPQFQVTDSPLFFVPAGTPVIVTELVRRMMNDGFFVNSAGFPATSMKRGGIRFMANGNLEKQDFAQMLDALAYHYPKVVKDEGSSLEQIARFFSFPAINIKSTRQEEEVVPNEAAVLKTEIVETIQAVDEKEWDNLMAERGNFTHSTLRMLEYVFSSKDQPENDWKFKYFKVSDEAGNVILNTFFSTVLLKDDMFSPASVSEQVEQIRETDPFYLTSKSVILGSPITKGQHLFLDRKHASWKKALELLLDEMHKTVERSGATQIMLREFQKDADPELKNFFMQQGLIEVDILNECRMDGMNWKDQDDYLAQLKGKYRYNVRKEILPFMDKFEMTTEKPTTQEEIRKCYELYNQVWEGAYEMNVHQLPFSYFESICHHPDYDVIRLYLKDAEEPGEPVAVMFSHRRDENYQALIVGLDYRYVRTFNTYKQILFRTVWRAWEIGCTNLDLAFTAELEKKKVGARPQAVCMYVQSMDHFNQAVLSQMAQSGKQQARQA